MPTILYIKYIKKSIACILLIMVPSQEKDILLIDKQAGWTSFDIVAKIRGMIRAQYQAQGVKPTKRQLKVGHTGTLDPFATGLVIVLLGDACSRSDEFL